MGRARGTKRTRGSWPPELLDLQRRGGMAPDWHDTWHGSGEGLRDMKVAQGARSEVFSHLSLDQLRSLRQDPWDRFERLRIFTDTLPSATEDFQEEDPLVVSLWMQENLRMQQLPLRTTRALSQKLEGLWKQQFVEETASSAGGGQPDSLYKYSLWLLLLNQGKSSAFSDKDREAVLGELYQFSGEQGFGNFVRDELLVAFSQQYHANPFWLYQKGDLRAKHIHYFIIRNLLPSDMSFAQDAEPDNFLRALGAPEIWDKDDENRFRFSFAVLASERIVFDHNLGQDLYPNGDRETELEIFEDSSEEAFYHTTRCLFEKWSRLSDEKCEEKLQEIFTAEQWREIREEVLSGGASGIDRMFRINPPAFKKLRRGEISFAEYMVASLHVL